MYNFRQGSDGLAQRGVARGGVVPYLVSAGGEIHLAFVLVQDAGLLAVEFGDSLVVVVVVEEPLVGADDLGILLQSLSQAIAEMDHVLDAGGGQKAVAMDGVGRLADSIHATRSLDKADDGPREVVGYDDMRILQVLALTEHIGRDQHAYLLIRCDASLVALRAEASGVGRWIRCRACHSRDLPDAALGQGLTEVRHGVGELGEYEHLVACMFPPDKADQGFELAVRCGVPFGAARQHLLETAVVLFQRLAERRIEHFRAYPLEAAFVAGLERLVERDTPTFGLG